MMSLHGSMFDTWRLQKQHNASAIIAAHVNEVSVDQPQHDNAF